MVCAGLLSTEKVSRERSESPIVRHCTVHDLGQKVWRRRDILAIVVVWQASCGRYEITLMLDSMYSTVMGGCDS